MRALTGKIRVTSTRVARHLTIPLVCGLLVFAYPVAVLSTTSSVLVVPIRIRVAQCATRTGQHDSQNNQWAREQVEAANNVYAPHKIVLKLARIDRFRPSRCELQTRRDRNQLAEFADSSEGQMVDILVMKRVQDLDVESYNLMGVHWRYRKRHWVFLGARARPPVLAHELCHYFGLRHDRAGGNLMTPGPSDPAWRSKSPPKPFAPHLTADQTRRLRRSIQRWRRLRGSP